MSDEEATEQAPTAAPPGRIAVRSPLEAFLWIFITRLIALFTATRVGIETAADAAEEAAAGGSVPDPARARRVAASRPASVGEAADAGAPARSPRPHPADVRQRALAVTAAASAVAGAAAFAFGRRRGRR